MSRTTKTPEELRAEARRLNERADKGANITHSNPYALRQMAADAHREAQRLESKRAGR